MSVSVREGTYKDKPLLQFMDPEQPGTKADFPLLSFGIRKARIILEHIDEIKAFVEKHREG